MLMAGVQPTTFSVIPTTSPARICGRRMPSPGAPLGAASNTTKRSRSDPRGEKR